MAQARIDADGGLRVVVSARDPGIANWVDTAGRHQGTVVFRNYRSKTAPVPSSRVVKLSDLPGLLPEGTATVTPEQRRADLAWRRTGFLKVYGE
jgi:hypothetical protein